MSLKKVLVANRGEIAVRIIKTLKKMGIASVAVASEADRHALHVQMADESVILGPAAVSESYLKVEAIVNAMEDLGADGVHPGYGLLSENESFVHAVESAGKVFIGPRQKEISSFGLKDKARELAEAAGVPLVPGSPPLASEEEALGWAEKVGFPVMLKAAAGGGGIGMQRCANVEELRRVFKSVSELAINNFGNGSVFLEKCIDRARHVEVQVFGDGEGEVLTLGTRDCSLQRRNQKVMEETPAPGLSPELISKMEASAKALCAEHAYRSAGTVEYIYDCTTDDYYFLEVNTRLQVEHTVTEEVHGIDLVEWMVRLAGGDRSFWPKERITSKGHAIQLRIYAEDPVRSFSPSTGEISHFFFPSPARIDTWVGPGVQVTPYYDPLLAKVIVHGSDREDAMNKMRACLDEAEVGGVQTNLRWLRKVLSTLGEGESIPTTKFIAQNPCFPACVEVLKSGVQTTVQDYPGRTGMWDVGVPPNGPMDDLSFRIGNRLLGNPKDAAGLECLLMGPDLKFHGSHQVCVTGANMEVKVNGTPVDMYMTLELNDGDVLSLGKVTSVGSRSYVLFKGGLQCPVYLDSRSTFTLGKYGGHCGRPLLVGDTLPLQEELGDFDQKSSSFRSPLGDSWDLRVLVGPHTSPEFFKDEDMKEFLETEWKVHFNSDRTGVRLIGPQPKWAREDGGEAGLHPSNIHDNAYSIGAMDFTGDQPVLLGPDGPSLGGFVCPFTIIKADLWKMGQLTSDDKVRFVPVSMEEAEAFEYEQNQLIETLSGDLSVASGVGLSTPILTVEETEPKLVIRQSGDKALLCEFGDLELDLALRIHVHFFMESMLSEKGRLFDEVVPGIRSIQFRFQGGKRGRDDLVEDLIRVHRIVAQQPPSSFDSRIIHLPLCWDDPSTRVAIEKYVTSVRPDAPWCCPHNIEFIRRVNGLESEESVKKIVYDASYLVMGLGDVYLGAPVAVPLDPRHRLVTTKYNPARTWTPENAVGIGGAYLCIYGMEGPGGYQFVGRTLPVWNRFKKTEAFPEPYLLRFFDQIRFYEVSPDELLEKREAFLAGEEAVKIEKTSFDVKAYGEFLDSISEEAEAFKTNQTQAFEAEKQRWRDQGLFSFDADVSSSAMGDQEIPVGAIPVTSPVSGAVWKVVKEAGQSTEEDETLLILESMKMEMPVVSPCAGKWEACFVEPGQTVESGQCLGYVTP